MPLTSSQCREFFEQGFVTLENVIPRSLVDAALREINHSLGVDGINPAAQQAGSYCPNIANSPVILDLFNNTSALELVESALGMGQVIKPRGSQIALRFPTLDNGPGKPLYGHLDGMYAPNNGVKKGTIVHFTMLVGVFLSDLIGPDSANFTVFPGTHRQFEAYFRVHTPQSLLQGMPRVQMPPPHQILARAGDVILAHSLLAHGVAINISPNVRYAIFFRIYGVDHQKLGWSTMTDIWAEWPGIRAAVGEAACNSRGMA